MKHKHRSSMTVAQLQILIAVAECHSFSEAALQLDMSQSNVSNAIATLEAELGVVLFSRGRHGAIITSIGERVLAYAHQMVQLQEQMVAEANLTKGLQGGQLRITAFRSVITHILSRAIAQFRQQFPDIAVSITENLDNSRIANDLRQGRADIGFIDSLLSDEFDVRTLVQDEYVVLMPPTFAATGSQLSWDQLSDYPLIMSADEDKHDQEVYAHCAAFGKSLNVVYRVRADSSIVSMVAHGLGATIIPKLAAEPIPASVQVFRLPVPLVRTIWVAVYAKALLPPAAFAFLEMLEAGVVGVSSTD